jgi:2-polyprenyl-6-methoxyphenol hydroxylase-like FAD-dependent oxidoreductase
MHVLIVGAGPAGALTALLLSRHGARVTLVERESDFERVFRGEGLMPSGLDALFEAGLGDAIHSLPGRVLESWDLTIQGREIFSVPEPREELGDRAVRLISQPALLERLVSEAERYPGFRLERGTAARGLLEEDGRVVGVRLQTPDEPRRVRADYVIGCDGRASLVRKRARLELALLPEHYDVLWFRLPSPERLREHCRFVISVSERWASACYPSWDDHLRWALALPKGAFAEKRDVDWVEELASGAPDWLAAHVRAVRDRIEGPSLLDVVVGRCPSWTAPGLLLLGDAAHPMSPVRAQGINLALRDAIVAANHLVPVLRAGGDPAALDAAGAAVQAEREPEIVRSQTLQYRDTRGLGTRAAPLLIALGKHVGGFLGRFDWAKRAWLAQQRDLRFGSTEVRLRV